MPPGDNPIAVLLLLLLLLLLLSSLNLPYMDNIVSVQTMQSYRGRGDMAPVILNLVLSKPPSPQNRMLGETYSMSDHFGVYQGSKPGSYSPSPSSYTELPTYNCYCQEYVHKLPTYIRHSCPQNKWQDTRSVSHLPPGIRSFLHRYFKWLLNASHPLNTRCPT
jgi:hypothetical protein